MKLNLLSLFLTAAVCFAQSAVNPQQNEIIVLVKKVSKGALSGTLVEYSKPERMPPVYLNEWQRIGGAVGGRDHEPLRTLKHEVIVRNATNIVVIGSEVRFKARKVSPLKGIEVWDCQAN